MDRKYIEQEHIVDRYLSGDLTVREAREFEKYCVEHPEFLKTLPIPVRLKARLSRQPDLDSETGMFKAIPSSATRAIQDAVDDGFEPEDEREAQQLSYAASPNRKLVMLLALLLIVSLGGVVMYAMRVSELTKQLRAARQTQTSLQMQAPASVQTYRVEPVRAKPSQPTLALGWLNPPQLLNLFIDVSEGKYQQFMLTIDNVENGRVMQIRRVARDSNRELRLSLNSSALGPGDYLVHIEGYTWRGQTDDVGWIMLGLK
ncbi:MAG TPA: hypothetical protein VFS24_13570 [Steroidobacteraceae bacterium]|nr:hypothetical protein [Steroidobacteraceae bacterium]